MVAYVGPHSEACQINNNSSDFEDQLVVSEVKC